METGEKISFFGTEIEAEILEPDTKNGVTANLISKYQFLTFII